MNFECGFLAILVFLSSAQCLYIQEAHQLPRVQALAKIGENSGAAVPQQKTVIIVPNSGVSSSPYRMDSVYPNSYGTTGVNPASTVVVVPESRYPSDYYTMPARTMQI